MVGLAVDVSVGVEEITTGRNGVRDGSMEITVLENALGDPISEIEDTHEKRKKEKTINE